jgi:cell fate regulator YaaT (PSP1 superfamily)
MSTIIGVRFKPNDRVKYFDSAGISLSVGDRVVVETEDGPREGRVAIAPGQVAHSDLKGPLSPALKRIEPDLD